MMAGPTLPALLAAALVRRGFERARGGRRWHRTAGTREQVLGLRRSRTGEDSWALYIAKQAPGAEPAHSFELSPVAPLSNTCWWPDEPTDQEVQELQAQVTQVVLPFFAAPARDPDQAQQQVQAALHGPDGWASHGPHSIAAALAWFENIQTTVDVLTLVRAEYRAPMTRNA